MKLNDPNRNRKAGFFGVAVATLLTPGGKLFTSAMAAAVTIAAVVSNMGPSQNPSGPSGAAIDTGALEATEKMMDISDLPTASDTQMLSAETLVEDPTAAPGNPATFTSQSMSSANFAGASIASAVGGNIGGGSGPIPVTPPLIFPTERENSEKAECTVVLVGELESNPELVGDEDICLEDDKVAKKNGDPESTGGDPESASKPVPESVDEPVSEPIVIALSSPSKPEPELMTPEYIGPTPEETSSTDAPTVERQLFQPLVSVAAVPEPTTLALFGLGLLGFAQVYRKNKHQK